MRPALLLLTLLPLQAACGLIPCQCVHEQDEELLPLSSASPAVFAGGGSVKLLSPTLVACTRIHMLLLQHAACVHQPPHVCACIQPLLLVLDYVSAPVGASWRLNCNVRRPSRLWAWAGRSHVSPTSIALYNPHPLHISFWCASPGQNHRLVHASSRESLRDVLQPS